MIPSIYNKALTFSFDDGVTQDVRLIEILNRYGLKCTFNLNSDLLGRDGALVRMGREVTHIKNKPEDIKYIYEGHEVASHTRTHPNLCGLTDDEIVSETEEDRVRLTELCGYDVVGMAYPCGGVNNNEHVADVIARRTNIKYVRTITSTENFEPQTYLYRFNPTVYHIEIDKMFALGEKFLSLTPQTPKIFYIWGHSYEFDAMDSWERFEEFCKMMSGKPDIFYGTNRDILL